MAGADPGGSASTPSRDAAPDPRFRDGARNQMPELLVGARGFDRFAGSKAGRAGGDPKGADQGRAA